MRWPNVRVWTKHIRSRSYQPRWFSAEQRPRGRIVDVPVGGSGNIQLEIHSPQRASSENNKILIFLPHGITATRNIKDGTSYKAQIPTILSSLLPTCTIITLNYRLNPPTHIFPLPIHDTATAFNHILHTLTQQATARISLLGSRLGGTLATSLALTSPNAIHSVVVTEPIVDWVSLDSGSGEDDSSCCCPESAIPTKRRPKPYQYNPADAKSLLSLRSQLFAKPDSYFDPFASPTLFLRAPGRDCPQPYLDSSDDISDRSEAFGPYDDDTNTHTHTHTRTHSFSSSSAEEETPAVLRPVKRRKVLRRWPANGSPESADLPRFRVFVGDDAEGEGMVLRQQGVELVGLMRKVCFYGQEKEVADMRVGVDVLPGRQGEGEGMLGIEEAARWLAQRQEEEDA